MVAGFTDRGHVVALDRAALDVADRHAVHEVVRAHRPEVVVNCSAWTDVDGCEGDPDRARRTNAEAVGHLSEAADRVGAHLVHVSTDFVFDGRADTPYPEDHPTGPLSTYGATKLAGEEAAGPSVTVMRTSWLQPADAPGMVERVLADLAGDDPVLLSDQRRACPTFVADLVPVLAPSSAQRAPPGTRAAPKGGQAPPGSRRRPGSAPAAETRWERSSSIMGGAARAPRPRSVGRCSTPPAPLSSGQAARGEN